MTNRGKRAEELLASILREPLLVDFVHLRPTYVRDHKTLELCDLLIEDEPKAIVAQLKVQDFEKAKDTRDPRRWARKQIMKASNQVSGALRRLRLSNITTRCPSRGTVDFQVGALIGVHGLVILDYSSTPFKIDDSLPRRNKNLIPIHYFSYQDFIVLCQNLMTLPDLIEYLKQRAEIPAWATPMLNDERNAYAYYHTHKGKFGPTLRLEDFEGQWKHLTQDFMSRYIEKLREDSEAEIFAQILKVMQERNPVAYEFIPEYIQKATSRENEFRVEATRKLNRLRRLLRREISKKLLEKIKLADTSPMGFNYFAFRSEDASTMYVFLASRHSRKKRVEELAVICDCINNIYDADGIIGIATENLHSKNGRSFDFIILDGRLKDTDPEAIEHCKELFGQMQFERLYDFPKENPRIIRP